MKKFYSIVLAALAVCAVSCQEGPLEKPEAEAPQTGETMTFTASFGDTKVTLGDDGVTPLWQKGDEITIYPTEGNKVVFTTQDAGSIAKFTANVSGKFVGPFHAVYGHQDKDKSKLYDNKITDVKIWKDQTVGDKESAPMMAYSSDLTFSQGMTLNFQNVGALLKFQLNAENVTSVKIVADAKISGDGSCDKTGSITLYDNKDQSFYEVILRPKDATFVKGDYYIVVAPASVKSLKMYVNDEIYNSLDFQDGLKFERSNIYNIGTIEEYLDYKITLSGLNNNQDLYKLHIWKENKKIGDFYGFVSEKGSQNITSSWTIRLPKAYENSLFHIQFSNGIFEGDNAQYSKKLENQKLQTNMNYVVTADKGNWRDFTPQLN